MTLSRQQRAERREAILRDYQDPTKKVSDIAAAYGVSRAYPTNIAERAGIPLRNPKPDNGPAFPKKPPKPRRSKVLAYVDLSALDEPARACFERNRRTGASPRLAMDLALDDMRLRAAIEKRRRAAQ